jgi:sigma-E factor negative regulatory protein RseA
MEPQALVGVNGGDMKMANAFENGSESREQLSALADGELSAEGVKRACALWRDEAELRLTWHGYHLIGDVMRSEDLACDAARDRAFLVGLRARLVAEPVVLAPSPAESGEGQDGAAVVAHRAARRSWRAPAAVAAGFVAVAGVLVVMRGPGSIPGTDTAPQLAQATPTLADKPAVVQQVTTAPTVAVAAAKPQVLVANGQLIRDAQLDRYLAAHKQFAGSSALGVPSAFLRGATSDAADR